MSLIKSKAKIWNFLPFRGFQRHNGHRLGFYMKARGLSNVEKSCPLFNFLQKITFFYFSKPNISAVHLGLSATGQASASVLFSGSVQKRFTRASRANFQTYTLLLKNNFSFYLPMFVRQKNIIFRILTWKDVKKLLFFFDVKHKFCLFTFSFEFLK